MRVFRASRRRRWLIAAACLAVAAPVAFVVSGVAAGKQAVATATPVVDPSYIYNQLFDMSNNDVYRVSGADGPPTDPSSPWNEPSTVNGWQELFQNWKSQLTDKTVMGNVAKFATVSDHYFQRLPEQRTNANYSFDTSYKWNSDDAEVTIPGATCAGLRVLLAAHPDGTPVTPAIVGDVINPTQSLSGANGFGAGRRELTLSNVANGGAYDDTSGVALTMGEYQALLKWYDANGTYPAETLKVALLDASAGRAKDGTYLREGAKYYVSNLIPNGPQGQYAMFAEMNANGLSYPAYHLGTQYYANNIANGGVGPWRTFITDTPSAPNAQYPDTGPGSSGANIAANSAAISQFGTNLQNAVTAGFAQQGAKYGGTVPQENPLRYNHTGSAPLPAVPTPNAPAYTASDQSTYSPVHPAGTNVEAQESTHEDEASLFWNRGIPGFSVGGVQDSNIDENPYPSTVSATVRSTPVLQYTGGGTAFELGSNVPVAAMTTSTAAVAAGSTTVPVTAVQGGNPVLPTLVPGQPFFIDTGLNLETGVITAVTNGTGNAGTVTVSPALTLAHASGVPFNVNQGQPVGFTGDTLEHLNFFASGAPHGIGGYTDPTVELLRALELPATYTALLASGSNYLNAVPAPTGTVAYFETNPVNPTSTLTVNFDAGFSRTSDGGQAGLQYYWDFGDGTHATGKTVSHTYSAARWADVKLVVVKGDSSLWGMYRQAVAVNSPTGAAPSTPACGTFSAAEQAQLIKDAKAALRPKPLASETAKP